MKSGVIQLRERYRTALEGHLAGQGEVAALHAYELGRQALADGIGLFELTAVHGDVVAALLDHASRPVDCSGLVRRADSFLSEALSPFEMAHRGFIEANAALRTLNATLERRVAERTAALEHLSLHDPLTDLPNRGLLQERLRQALADAGRIGSAVAILVLDVESFKEFNDALGHQKADLLLKEIGVRLQSTLRETDTVGRGNGDEFLMIVPGADQLAAGRIARKLLEALSRPLVVNGTSIDVGASIGIAAFPDHGDDVDVLLRHADTAVYAGKRSPEGIEVYQPEQDEDHRRSALVAHLRRAIERREFALHYQPQVDMRQRRFVGAEALLRWHHPERGNISPAEFIPVAERRGLMRPLTRWVLESAIQQEGSWCSAGLDLPVAINLSTRNLLDPALPPSIRDLSRNLGVGPEKLVLEITESAILAEPDAARRTVAELRAMGIRLSIDDFGTGYSSLAYLHRLDVDEIKIDKSFVLAMTREESAETIVRATIDLGHSLGIQVVAEGVENRDLWDRLVALGCDRGQGYFISRPIPADQIEKILKTSRFGFDPAEAAA